MSPQFDHAVVIVRSLGPAVRRFERLGFHVVYGGRTGPVHNALVCFQDGTYIELTTNRFSMARPLLRALHVAGVTGKVAARRNDMLKRFLPWIGAPVGAIDWCIRVDDVRRTIQQLRESGIKMVDAMPFERQRPDGQIAKWLLAGPQDPRLPFLIEDITPIETRVPSVPHGVHPNGITGIRALALPRPAQQEFSVTMGPALGGSMLGTVDIVAADHADRFKGPFVLELKRSDGVETELDRTEVGGLTMKFS